MKDWKKIHELIETLKAIDYFCDSLRGSRSITTENEKLISDVRLQIKEEVFELLKEKK